MAEEKPGKILPFDPGSKRDQFSVDEKAPIKASRGSTAFGGGNGVDSEQKDYIDAKTDAVRAQNDARFAEVLAKLDHLPSTGSTAWMIFGALIAGVGIVLAIVAFGGDRFDGGVQLSSVSVQQAIEAKNLAAENAKQVDILSTKIDTLVDILREQREDQK